MAIATAIAIYFLIWWIMLFAVLPWGVRSQGEEGCAPGHRSGRAHRAAAQGQAAVDHNRRRRGVGDLRGALRQRDG